MSQSFLVYALNRCVGRENKCFYIDPGDGSELVEESDPV
jgi:hypothetical protein